MPAQKPRSRRTPSPYSQMLRTPRQKTYTGPNSSRSTVRAPGKAMSITLFQPRRNAAASHSAAARMLRPARIRVYSPAKPSAYSQSPSWRARGRAQIRAVRPFTRRRVRVRMRWFRSRLMHWSRAQAARNLSFVVRGGGAAGRPPVCSWFFSSIKRAFLLPVGFAYLKRKKRKRKKTAWRRCGRTSIHLCSIIHPGGAEARFCTGFGYSFHRLFTKITQECRRAGGCPP